MDLVYARCAAIDVHKRTAVVSVGWLDEQAQRHGYADVYHHDRGPGSVGAVAT